MHTHRLTQLIISTNWKSNLCFYLCLIFFALMIYLVHKLYKILNYIVKDYLMKFWFFFFSIERKTIYNNWILEIYDSQSKVKSFEDTHFLKNYICKEVLHLENIPCKFPVVIRKRKRAVDVLAWIAPQSTLFKTSIFKRQRRFWTFHIVYPREFLLFLQHDLGVSYVLKWLLTLFKIK